MAGLTSAQVRNLREHQTHAHGKVTHISRKSPRRLSKTTRRSIQGKRGNSIAKVTRSIRTTGLSRNTLVRYEKYSKYWSILSNFAAVVSVTGALFGLMKKRRFW